MELKIWIDSDCDLCKRGLAKLEKLQRRHPNAYGSKFLSSKRLVGKVELVPDYNSSGVMTHMHIR